MSDLQTNLNIGNGGSITLDVTAPNTIIANQLATHQPFTPNQDIALGANLGFKVESLNQPSIPFGSTNGTITVSAQANVFAGIGVYWQPTSVLDALKEAGHLQLDDSIASGLQLSPEKMYFLLKSGYDVKASANADIPLNGIAGKVSFGVEAGTQRLFAIIRECEQTIPSDKALTALINSWMIPEHIPARIKDFDPGTYLVMQVDGAINAKLGVTAGYDTNYVRKLSLPNINGKEALSGDIGLRLQLGLETTLGIDVSGKYAFVVNREGDKKDRKVRLRLFKQHKNGWNFALHAGAALTPHQDILPANFDELCKAILGIQPMQLLKDLEDVLTPGKTIDTVLGITQPLVAKYIPANIQSQIITFVAAWKDLPHAVGSVLWKELEKSTNAATWNATILEITTLLGKIQGDDKDWIKAEIEKIGFTQSPIGKILQSMVEDNLVALLAQQQEWQRVKTEIVLPLLKILDGGNVQSVLEGLVKMVLEQLNLTPLGVVASPTKLTGFLRARLEKLLERALNNQDIVEIRNFLNILRTKLTDNYAATLRALSQEYKAQLEVRYQESTSDTALLDIVFDLNNKEAARYYTDALKGEFSNVLQAKSDQGVEIKMGVLTHQLKRDSFVELTLPFYNASFQAMTNIISRATVVQDKGLFLYDLTASSIVQMKNKYFSKVAIAIGFGVGVNSAVRIHSTDSLAYSYTYRTFVKGATTAQLQPLLTQYCVGDGTLFANNFPNPQGTANPLNVWLTDLDKAVDTISDNGTGTVGDTLINLEFSLRSTDIFAAWKNAPLDRRHTVYKVLSGRVQETLRRFVRYAALQPTAQFSLTSPPVAAALVYASFPPISYLSVASDGTINVIEEPYNGTSGNHDKIHWYDGGNYSLEAMLGLPSTAQNLIPILTKLGYSTSPNNLNDYIFSRAYTQNPILLRKYAIIEQNIINAARNAAIAIAQSSQTQDPIPAQQLLEAFGSSITEIISQQNLAGNLAPFFPALNSSQIGTFLNPLLLTSLFLEISLALKNAPNDFHQSRASAMLGITVLKNNLANLGQIQTAFLEQGTTAQEADIALSQAFVNPSAIV